MISKGSLGLVVLQCGLYLFFVFDKKEGRSGALSLTTYIYFVEQIKLNSSLITGMVRVDLYI